MEPDAQKNFIASVLLVDDDVDFLDLLAERLTHRGMNVATASNGYNALHCLSQERFDIIVIDLSMPGMDGIETMKKIKEKHPNAEMIMLTGHATLERGIEAMKTGAEDFLQKPADIDLLIQKVHEAQYRRLRELEKSSEEAVKKICRSKGW